MNLQEALELIIDVNSELLKHKLPSNDDLLVLQSQEVAIRIHDQIVNCVPC